MKRLIASLVVAVLFCSAVYATQVNPTSNVLGNTEGAADTLVLRNSDGKVDAADLIDEETILTAHIKTSSVLTAHSYLDLTALRLLCVKTNKMIGECIGGPAAGTNTCDCR